MSFGPIIKSIGYWMSERKAEKLNIQILKELCKIRGYNLVKLDLTKSIEEQGPFCIIFHKCTEVMVKANSGDRESLAMLQRLQKYIDNHPEVPIVDRLEKIQRVLNRFKCFEAVRDNQILASLDVFAPTSVVLTSNNISDNLAVLAAAGVRYPFVSKALVSHGCEAHRMAVIFNEKGVIDCEIPAVAQTFINHNATLYKIYCIGDKCAIVERPSLRNFYSSQGQETIHFSSADVSKPNSTSNLTVMDVNDPMRNTELSTLDHDRLRRIAEVIREVVGLALMGVDVVIDNASGRYAVIDINVFPGYDGFPDMWDAVLSCLDRTMVDYAAHIPANLMSSPTCGDHDDSGCDTCDSSDEKTRRLISVPPR